MEQDNWLETLFTDDVAVIAANKAEFARIAAVEAASKVADLARAADAKVLAIALRCPKCAGSGRIAQFSHRKGGECFLCGGSGVFSRG
jgi:hypothetical protein